MLALSVLAEIGDTLNSGDERDSIVATCYQTTKKYALYEFEKKGVPEVIGIVAILLPQGDNAREVGYRMLNSGLVLPASIHFLRMIDNKFIEMSPVKMNIGGKYQSVTVFRPLHRGFIKSEWEAK